MATKAAEKPSRSRTARSKQSTNLGAIAGAAAAGVTVGMLAVIGRKIAVQAPTFLAGEWDEALAAEHAAVLKLFDAIEATTDRNTIKRSILLAQLKHALAKHALEEENAVYPALRQIGEVDGADELNKEHGYVKQYLYDLENLPNGSPAFLDKIRAFRSDIEHHMREEEDVLFPKLKSTLGDKRNKQLTAAMNKEGFKLA